jgi:hypothetical protein
MAFMMRTTLPPDVHSYRSILAPQSMPEYFTSTLGTSSLISTSISPRVCLPPYASAELIGGVEKELAVEGLPEKVKIICAILLVLFLLHPSLSLSLWPILFIFFISFFTASYIYLFFCLPPHLFLIRIGSLSPSNNSASLRFSA